MALNVSVDSTTLPGFAERSGAPGARGIIGAQSVFPSVRAIRSHIAYGAPQASRAEIEASARAANAHDFVMALPQKYETLIGERGQRLCRRGIMVEALACRGRQSQEGVELMWICRCELPGESRDDYANG